MNYVITGGRVLDPAGRRDEVGDLFITDGRVAKKAAKGAKRIKAAGCWVVPGLVDIHVHFREPGLEAKETILDGCRAAVAGGFTSVATMANTGTPVDSAMAVRYVRDRAAEAALARVYPIGAITKGLKGEELAELGLMAEAGAVGFSDDGFPVMNSELMRRALEYADMFGRPVIDHCEDLHLTKGAAMNEGRTATELGLRGWPDVAEASMAARDVLLAEWTGARVHIAHVSARPTIAVIRDAKRRGVRVTAEASPHHLTLDESALRTYDPRFKMNPPLRAAADAAALVEAVADGTIDAIATDHAPHTTEEKELEYAACANGIVGLETAVPVILGLVEQGALSPLRAMEAMSLGPARVLNLEAGTLAPGAPADVAVIDPRAKLAVDPATFKSRGRCTPWAGRTLTGRAVMTLVGGRPVFEG